MSEVKPSSATLLCDWFGRDSLIQIFTSVSELNGQSCVEISRFFFTKLLTGPLNFPLFPDICRYSTVVQLTDLDIRLCKLVSEYNWIKLNIPELLNITCVINKTTGPSYGYQPDADLGLLLCSVARSQIRTSIQKSFKYPCEGPYQMLFLTDFQLSYLWQMIGKCVAEKLSNIWHHPKIWG